MMLYRSPDGSFIIYDRPGDMPSVTCNHVQPGVVDFPGRCVLSPDHKGKKHQGGTSYIGYPQNPPLPPEQWENDDA
jgi:hypothetical protein